MFAIKMIQLQKVYLSIGSNLGDKYQNIRNAYKAIQQHIGEITSKSSIYITPPWGFKSDSDFYNSILEVYTSLKPKDLLATIKQIEKDLGRQKKQSNVYESRLIDIDIIDYNQQIFNDTDLSVPHPLMSERSFVVVPLSQINPNWIHPKTQKNIKEIKAHLKEKEINKLF
jgi:2-amino-4-hydroxy-6-hydroxymethyldihydropteridine diphosphokinase